MLAVGAGLSAVAFAIAVVGLIVDPIVLTGAPAWMKPAKFSFSIAVYLLTLRWILSHVRGHARLLAVLSTIITVALVAEIALVEMQVMRGTTSHYNETSDFDAAVWYAMGGIVSLVLIATIAAGVLALKQRGLDPGLAAGLRWGIGICVLGMLAAVTMIFNKEWNDSGGHTVGAADGGAGMPITGWSLEHGDLRVGHFIGLHALQLLPLLAWALLRFTHLDATTRARLLTVAGATLHRGRAARHLAGDARAERRSPRRRDPGGLRRRRGSRGGGRGRGAAAKPSENARWLSSIRHRGACCSRQRLKRSTPRGRDLMPSIEQTVVITGASGRIGRAVVPLLRRPGRMLRLVDTSPTEFEPGDDVSWHDVSIEDADGMEAVLARGIRPGAPRGPVV